ncbi:MAG: protein DpdH [Chloroflexi bacterium]|nr:protein DpdH [Chloroflexota bacterium]
MTFERVVCWDPARVERVMRFDADVALPAVFMAVHTDEPLSFERPQGHRSATEFLDDFLGNSGDVRAVVIGDSGSGKSHLVKWVELNIPTDRPDLRLVSVPRSGTSLRWIVEQLIEVLPHDLQGNYRERLVAAPDSPVRIKELELRLLTEVAVALGRSEHTDEVDAELADGLSAFFLDPGMKEHHARETGIVGELVRHITSPSSREDRDTRRRFEEVDLHLDSAVVRLNDFAAPTVSLLLQLLGNPELRDRAVRVVNEQLDAAVERVLGLGAGELTELLNEIRGYLRSLGQTLVLLVEDFVRTEGIDRALLDALIDSRDELCDLRLLFAVTTGYYERELIETQKTRLHYIINLDQRPALDEGDRLAPFAARYLNALRLDERALERWHKESRSEGPAPPLPNACAGCEHREPCHAAFGSRPIGGSGDVGLYPFTAFALSNMAQRARERSPDHAAVDPRALLRDILTPIVDRRALLLEGGDFPDANLVENHGGHRLPLHLREQISALSGAEVERYRALLELWSAHPGEATELPADLYRALALAPLELGEAPPLEPPEPTVEEPEVPYGSNVPRAVRERLQTIETWANGGPMTRVTNDLRALVMSSVAAAIDWDREGLERAVFGGGRGTARESFAPTSIDFARQDTREASRAVKLRLPLDNDANSQLRTARALEGLVNFDHYGDWRFPQGREQLLRVSEEVPLWAEHVAQQLRRVIDPEEEWDPVASSVEVLAVGAALASRPPRVDASLAERLAAILDEAWPDPADLEVRSDRWRELYRSIHKGRGELRELVLAHASAMKGGQSGSMIDANRVTRPLRAISRDWQMREAPPTRLANANLPPRYRRLFDLHSDVVAALPDAAEDERAQRLTWLDELRTYISEGVARREVVDSIERLLDAIEDGGVPVRGDYRRALMDALDLFRSVQLDEAIRMTEELRDREDAAHELLPRLAGERRGNAMHAWELFRDPVTRFLSDAASKVQSEKEKIGGVQTIEHGYARIESAFAELEAGLATVLDS